MRQRGGLPGNPQAMAQQRQFPGGIPQLGVNNSSPFPHDPSQGLSNAQPQFGNPPGGQNFANPLHMQTLSRNASQMFTNQGGHMRQLDLMMAQNQQNQNGVPNSNTMAALHRQLAQQQQQQQQSHTQSQAPHQQPSQMGAPQIPPGLFGNMNAAQMQPGLQNLPPQSAMNPNRAPNGMMPHMQDGQMQAQQQSRRPITLQEMSLKAHEFRQAITAGENRIKTLQSQAMTSQVPQDAIAAEISKVQKEVMDRRQALTKILNYVRANTGNNAIPTVFANGSMDM